MGSERHPLPVEVVTGTRNEAAAAELDPERSRRVLLKGLGVAAAGAVVGGVLAPEEAQAHGPWHVDSNNGDPAIHGNNTDGGPGVQGDSANGIGVLASGGNRGVQASSGFVGVDAQGDSVGVRADSLVNGVQGSGGNIGVLGNSPGNGVQGGGGNIGVLGISSVVGVRGSGGNSGVQAQGGTFGVDAQGDTAGVVGFSNNGTGVRARTNSGTALDVVGPARFSTAGAGTIPAQQNSVVVSNPAVTANSHITMTYTGNPGITSSGTFAAVVWVQRQPGTGFTARLSRKVTNATPFTYLIVEPG
jgi:hypothetical protein